MGQEPHFLQGGDHRWVGHAWVHRNLTTEAQDEFIAFRRLPVWNDDSVAWEDKGSEHAAEILAWALMDEEIRLLGSETMPPMFSLTLTSC